ncbi:hypothetical protein R1sor_024396 [Riccia sorocarpa]|uniref:Serine-threonine/tyrosine-protein kinase catalytic domain-containing protein n=1 Tax=Riccia sorocarpa TaxID=122646 RepID=A0ABD3GTL9_9MARC
MTLVGPDSDKPQNRQGLVKGLITEKLDVYSYGVLLLEIISGRKCIDSTAPADEFYLRSWAFKLKKAGCLLSIADQHLLPVTSAEEIESVLNIALSCLQVMHDKRPSMSEVVTMLTSNSSGVAVEVVEELIDQQVLYNGPYEMSTVSGFPDIHEREDEVLLEACNSSDSRSFIELSLTKTR